MFAPSHPLQMFFGLIVWSAWFVTLYGGLTVACSLTPPDVEAGGLTWLNITLLLLGLLISLFLLYCARRCWKARPEPSAESGVDRDNQRFIASAASAVYLIGAFATLAVAMPALMLPPCT
jgi:type VI protein secretion system component VasK